MREYILRNIRRISLNGIAAAVVLTGAVFTCVFSVQAKAPEEYSASSALSSGKWVKIKVTQTGVQTLTAARLRQLGFTDITKVNVYGYGGRMIKNGLDASQVDDLPLQPVVRTAGGILFYGVNNIGFSQTADSYGNYRHTINDYSDDSYYFLSDREVTPEEMQEAHGQPVAGLPQITTFRQMLVHERDLMCPVEMGRLRVGEDFRAGTLQAFPFQMPGKVDESIWARVNFASIASGASTLQLLVDGKNVSSAMSISGVGSAFVSMKEQTHNFKVGGNQLNLQLKFTGGAALSKANLDWIEIGYIRELALNDGQLVFKLSPKAASNVVISGCDAQTIVWDVTNPGHPKAVKTVYSDGKMTFGVNAGNYEFVAFAPAVTTLQPVGAGVVANQDIHSLEVPDYLIISPREYLDAANRVAALHRDRDGMIVHVLTPEQIYNEFSSGVRDLGAFRKVLKMWYDRGEVDGHKIRYCLLLGRPNNDVKSLTGQVDGINYINMPIWQLPVADNQSSRSENSSYSTDDYIGMLDDSTDDTFQMTTQKIRVAVGRFPVKSVEEANAAVDKLEKYLLQPVYGNWRNSIVMIADEGDNGLPHYNQSQSCYNNFTKSTFGDGYRYERMYLDKYEMKYTAVGPQYTDARTRLYKLIDDGIMYLQYVGHANPKGWGHEKLMTWEDIQGLRNKNLPFITAATCEFGMWDGVSLCGAEEMWLNRQGGAIGFITASRKVYISNSGNWVISNSNYIFRPDDDGKPRRIGDFYIAGKNDVRDDTRLRYMLMGDPAMSLVMYDKRVVVDEIADVDLTDAGASSPVVNARSKFKVKGHIEGLDGLKLDGFNGTLEATLMDAEVVVETLGQGEMGEKVMYNDRVTQLYTGKTKVAGGEFELTVTMPSEIENNYSPAQLIFYAYSDKGMEANGATDRLYVYGYDENAPEDTEGPKIERFALNSDNFADNDVTHSTPVVYATLSDESGINLSEGGIGHKLTLTLDGEKIYDDLASYFENDPLDYTRGTLAYVMPAIEPGEHKLKLTAWDNANNSSTATINFRVGVNRAPTLYDVTTNVNPATSSVTFILTHDRPQTDIKSTVDVYDLNGRKVWSGTTSGSSGIDGGVQIQWNLTNGSGERVPRGIYVYRAMVTTSEGTTATKSKKLAVTGS